jgi:hypothetical protein
MPLRKKGSFGTGKWIDKANYVRSTPKYDGQERYLKAADLTNGPNKDKCVVA